MSTAVIDHLPDAVLEAEEPAHSPPPPPERRAGVHPILQQEYLEGRSALIHRAASKLMELCVLQGRALPSSVVSALQLPEKDCHAIGMAHALIKVPDLEERQKILHQVIRAIVELQESI
ncbi:MAG: hypothetical protein PHI23_02940 [Candidatus Peribacteraceae bacterium]|nr:hypothetical protein [Candidatus Peribacteraceae bacterium]